jgi:hypothetical protein
MKILLVSALFRLAATFSLSQQSVTGGSGDLGFLTDPGMYVRELGGFHKILGQIETFTRSGRLLVFKVTIGIKTRKENVQLVGSKC